MIGSSAMFPQQSHILSSTTFQTEKQIFAVRLTGQSSIVNKFKIAETTQLSVLYAMTFPVTIQSSSSHKVLITDVAMIWPEPRVITFVDGEG